MARAGAAVKESKKQNLPGMADMGIPEIQDAAAGLMEVRNRRIALGKEESESEATLIKIMQKQTPPRDYYKHDGLEVTVSKGKDKAKVKFGESNGDGE